MKLNDKIYVAGHLGLAGSAIVKNLKLKGYKNLIFRSHAELDLINQEHVANFFEQEKPNYVILAAATVGGIIANNKYRADFIYENLQIQNNVIHQSYLNGVDKLLFLGSTCIYPKETPQPMSEEYLLTSPLEYTNEPYAIAKIAGVKMCESYNIQYGTNFISVMPTNLYGTNDTFNLEKSHVLPSLLKKMHLAKLLSEKKYDELINEFGLNNPNKLKEYLAIFGVYEDKVEIWGTGNPRREFLYSDDMADACIFLLENYDFKDLVKPGSNEIRNTHINIGTGEDISISELAKVIKQIVGFSGDIFFNTDKPDGTMFKLTNIDKISSLGWSYKIKLLEGIQKVYDEYMK
jgi:GDP-L-fucose synthase